VGARGRIVRSRPYAAGFWSAPIFEGVRARAEALPPSLGFPSVATLDACLFANVRALGLAIALEVQPPLPARGGPKPLDALYDVRISDAGRVPTREASWHDLMNALVFASFPLAKLALHARHAMELRGHYARAGRLPNARSRLQDVLALFDEGGVLFLGRPPALAQAARAASHEDHPGLGALVTSGDVRAIVFGHAVLEHAALGEPLPRAMPLFLPSEDAHAPKPGGPIDAALANVLTTLDPTLRHQAIGITGLFETPRAAP